VVDPKPPESVARLLDELSALRTEVEGLRTLLEVSRQLSSILDPDALLDAILDSAIVLTGARRGLLLAAAGAGWNAARLEAASQAASSGDLVPGSGSDGHFRVLLGRGSDQVSLDPETSRVSETLARQCLAENRVIPYDNLASLAEFQAVRSIRALSLYAAVCVPLRERGRPTGVLYLDSSSPGLRTSARELALLEAFAAQASISLVNAGLMKRAEESRLLLVRENQGLRMEVRAGSGLGGILGRSRAMQAVFERIRLLKDAPVPVLVLGESGTGKELVARALHYEGVRRDAPFVPVNCAGLPGDLLDSLMFGHRRGAFTGAVSDMPGFVEQAQGGTLFLDEIGDMPAALQVKLLRFLETGEFRRVGEVELRKVEARVVSATNQDLARMVREKTFREDLYFRLAGVCLEVPPLRERREDIPLLVESFRARSAERHGRSAAGLTERARAFLLDHPWPGNVRQLRQTVEGACALVPEGSLVDEEHVRMIFPQREEAGSGSTENAEPAGTTARTVETAPEEAPGLAETRPRRRGESERELLREILARNQWNITRAARELGVSRQHLHNRIRLYGLRRPE
jgi:Nif-specific regulatory protein